MSSNLTLHVPDSLLTPRVLNAFAQLCSEIAVESRRQARERDPQVHEAPGNETGTPALSLTPATPAVGAVRRTAPYPRESEADLRAASDSSTTSAGPRPRRPIRRGTGDSRRSQGSVSEPSDEETGRRFTPATSTLPSIADASPVSPETARAFHSLSAAGETLVRPGEPTSRRPREPESGRLAFKPGHKAGECIWCSHIATVGEPSDLVKRSFNQRFAYCTTHEPNELPSIGRPGLV